MANDFHINEALVQDWFEHSRQAFGAPHGRHARDLPCTAAWISLFLAYMKRRHRHEDATDDGGNLYDHDHYVYGAFAGCLATDDKDFRKVIDLIEWRPVRVLSIRAFLDEIRQGAS